MGIALAFCAALFWGAADFSGGRATRHTNVLIIGIGAQLVSVLIAVPLVLIQGAPTPSNRLIVIGLAAGFSAGIGLVGVYSALAMGNMARVAPILATSAVGPVVIDVASGEALTAVAIGGIVLAVVGVSMISVERRRDPGATQTKYLIPLAVVTALALGMALVGIDQVAGHDPSWAILLTKLAGLVTVGTVSVIWFATRPTPSVGAEAIRAVVSIGVLDTAANVAFAWASTLVSLAVVAVIGSMFPAVTVILSVVILRESLSRFQALGAIVTLFGAAVLASQ